jgi:hypothetical protein
MSKSHGNSITPEHKTQQRERETIPEAQSVKGVGRKQIAPHNLVLRLNNKQETENNPPSRTRKEWSQRDQFTVIAWLLLCLVGACAPAADREQDAKTNAAASQKKIYEEIIAKMDMHVKRGLDCLLCHKEVTSSTEEKIGATENTSQPAATAPDKDAPGQSKPKLLFDMKCCVNCHRSYGKEIFCAIALPNRLVDCRTCHRELRKDVKPQYHYQNWLKRHASYVDMNDKAAAECTMCHGRSGCTNCHRAQKPASHNNFWRQRLHGIAAGNRRDQCNLCHTSDYCQRCHATTTPQNHTSSWLNMHCFSCHEPLSDNRCAVCHRKHHSAR